MLMVNKIKYKNVIRNMKQKKERKFPVQNEGWKFNFARTVWQNLEDQKNLIKK